MKRLVSVQVLLSSTLAIGMYLAGGTLAGASAPVAVNTARISLSGTSNIHEYTASTTTIRVTRAELGNAASGAELWTMPGGIAAFEVAIPAATLTSPREGVDKNMHKALKVQEHADITFKLLRFEGKDETNATAVGVLTIARVEREVRLNVTMTRAANTLSVKGEVALLMTDFGIAPPKAMLGMLKTDPKVTVTFEAVLAAPLT